MHFTTRVALKFSKVVQGSENVYKYQRYENTKLLLGWPGEYLMISSQNVIPQLNFVISIHTSKVENTCVYSNHDS